VILAKKNVICLGPTTDYQSYSSISETDIHAVKNMNQRSANKAFPTTLRESTGFTPSKIGRTWASTT
jgi:hypothetical protein